MPDITVIPELYYQPLDPYHWVYDNLPLKNILERQLVINSAVDVYAQQIRNSVGTQGTLDNRLSQSTDEDGNLKPTAIDQALHNIAEHADGSKNLTLVEIAALDPTNQYLLSSPVPFTRMLSAERSKLALISPGATALEIQVDTISTTRIFDDETMQLIGSSTITWSISGDQVQANTVFPATAAHEHYYNVTPNNPSVDYTNYELPVIGTTYVDGSLRVYVNGVRLNESHGIYVPDADDPSIWVLRSYVAATDGSFEMNAAIQDHDVIRVDFDGTYI